MTDGSKRRAVISGIGISRIGRKTGIPGLDLTEESCRMALADAGLKAADIDGVATMGDTPVPDVVELLGLQPEWDLTGSYSYGGLLEPVFEASDRVTEGPTKHVLIYRTVQMLGGSVMQGDPNRPPGPSRQPEGMSSMLAEMQGFIAHHAYSAANWVAMHCRRHMHLYGTTREQLGSLAISSREHAARNPRAAYRDPITMDDYLSARPISDPLGLLDCDVPVDGSIALVVSTPDCVADLPHPPVSIEAFGGGPAAGTWNRPDYPKMDSVDAASELWSRTSLKPSDVDVAELYDGFTFLTFAWLEALGFCGDGEAGPFVEGGARIGLGGELPLNTYGGQLSAGRMHGYWVLHEACLQLRHEAEARQVAGAEVAAVAVGGGSIAGCMLLTR